MIGLILTIVLIVVSAAIAPLIAVLGGQSLGDWWRG